MTGSLKLLLAAAVAACLAVGAAAAAGNGAQKAPLVHLVRQSCDGSGLIDPPDPLPVGGFALVNQHNGVVTANLSLRNALPHHEYQTFIVQPPLSLEDCIDQPEGVTLTTNGRGNGNVQLSEPAIPGATAIFVQAIGGPFEFFNTPNVPVES